MLASDPSEPALLAAIKRAVIQFCDESWVWKHQMDPIDVVAAQLEYDLEPLAGTDVSTVMTVKLDGVRIDPRRIDQLEEEMPDWNTIGGRPKYWTQTNQDQIILARVPDMNMPGQLQILLALKPTQRATSFPKWIYSQYVYDIAKGAIAYLMLMPKKQWTAKDLGAEYMKEFEAAIAKARDDGVKGLSRAPVRVTSQH